MLDPVQDQMEGCPDSRGLTLLYLVLSAMLGSFIFLCYLVVSHVQRSRHYANAQSKREKMADNEFHDLQQLMFSKSDSGDSGGAVNGHSS